jgi:hypothetical protein
VQDEVNAVWFAPFDRMSLMFGRGNVVVCRPRFGTAVALSLSLSLFLVQDEQSAGAEKAVNRKVKQSMKENGSKLHDEMKRVSGRAENGRKGEEAKKRNKCRLKQSGHVRPV